MQGKGGKRPNRNISQSINVWTRKTKSLLPSLYKREEFPLFGKEGLGEIFEEHVFSIMDSLVIRQSRVFFTKETLGVAPSKFNFGLTAPCRSGPSDILLRDGKY